MDSFKLPLLNALNLGPPWISQCSVITSNIFLTSTQVCSRDYYKHTFANELTFSRYLGEYVTTDSFFGTLIAYIEMSKCNEFFDTGDHVGQNSE